MKKSQILSLGGALKTFGLRDLVEIKVNKVFTKHRFFILEMKHDIILGTPCFKIFNSEVGYVDIRIGISFQKNDFQSRFWDLLKNNEEVDQLPTTNDFASLKLIFLN